jgi:hypothetical protein
VTRLAPIKPSRGKLSVTSSASLVILQDSSARLTVESRGIGTRPRAYRAFLSCATAAASFGGPRVLLLFSALGWRVRNITLLHVLGDLVERLERQAVGARVPCLLLARIFCVRLRSVSKRGEGIGRKAGQNLGRGGK